MIEKAVKVKIKKNIQPYHWHETLEIDFVLSGSMTVVMNNTRRTVKEGEIILLNLGDIHCIENSTEDLLYMQMEMDLEAFDSYVPEISSKNFLCGPENNDAISLELKKEIKSYMVKICTLIDERNNINNYENSMIYCCIEILNNLTMAFLGSEHSRCLTVSEEQAERIWKIIDYIYDYYKNKITLTELSRELHLSGPHVSRIIRKFFGESYEGLVAFVRAEISVRYLLNSNFSITNIAYECGFSAPRYYIKAFQKIYDCTPAEYRERNKLFFKLEKPVYSEGIVYDEGINKEELFAVAGGYIIEEDANSPIASCFDKRTVEIGEQREIRLTAKDIKRLEKGEKVIVRDEELSYVITIKTSKINKK